MAYQSPGGYMKRKRDMKRRHFLKNSLFGVAGIGMMPRSGSAETVTITEEEKKTLKIQEYRTLGRTGFKVSDIGGGFLRDAGLIRAMLESGVNYLDTAESYGNQKIIGEAIQGFDRKKIFITSKLEVKEDVSKEGFIKRTLTCLEELQTDYIDCMMMHMPEKREILKTAGFHSAMDQLKKEGRIRSVGVANHGSFWFLDPAENMESVLLTAADDGRFDLMMMAYNFLRMDGSEKVLEVCRKKNIGTALMKTKPVTTYYNLKSRIEELKKEGKEINELYVKGLERYQEKAKKAEAFLQRHNLTNPEEIISASVRFVLSNPDVGTVCCSMRNFDDLERFVSLSGTRLTDDDPGKLLAFQKNCGDLYCRHACGLCEPHCPRQVPVNTIMRFDHYFATQGREKEAMRYYAAISGNRADLCKECSGLCEQACPYQVPIQAMLTMAHEHLSLV
jgi:predicted aldo/keto reductase-like oxidoreductase